MKKIISAALLLLYLFGIPLFAYAEEATLCTIAAGSAVSLPGEEVQVPVSISGNPGFTNFAVSLEYDSSKLELLSINTAEGEAAYLCGEMVSTNTDWKNEEGESCGFLVAASAEPVTGDGTLFTATFRLTGEFDDPAEVIPQVHYIRNNGAVFSFFEEITPTVTTGAVTAIVLGDVTGDGMVEYDDVMLIYKAALGTVELTGEQTILADINKDGIIDSSDVNGIYGIYTGG